MSTEIKIKTKRQKTVYSKFSDIAHIFANEPGRDVRCRNGFVKDDVIYSYGYHFPIANRNVDKKGKTTIFFTLDTYSSVTAQHIRDVNWGTRHLDTLYMLNVPKYKGSVPDHNNNIEYWLVKIQNCFEKFEKARECKKSIHSTMLVHVDRLKKYLEFFKIKPLKKVRNILEIALDPKWSNEITAFYKRRAEKLVDPKAIEKKEKARLARERAEERESAEQIVKWRNFQAFRPYINKKNRYYNRSSRPDLLRYNANKERIETSQGVEIPVEIAHKFYRYIQIVLAKGGCTSEECCNYKLLDVYRVTEITNEHIRVGCHKIKQTEVNNIAKQLNWI